MITADPYALIAGVTASIHPGADVVFTDAYTITWGRAGVLEAPTPATATVRLLDLSAGASLARRTDLIGADLRLGYTSGAAPAVLSFRGRITDVSVERRRDGGFFVSLAASSREVEAANFTVPEGVTWPAETFGARLNRITALLPSTLLRTAAQGGPPVVLPARADFGLYTVPDQSLDFSTYTAGPAQPGGSDALTLLRELFASVSPLPMIYDPSANIITFAGRRRYQYLGAAGGVVTATLTAPPGRNGLYVATAYQGRDLDAHDVDAVPALAQPLESRLTQVEVTYLNGAAAYASATVTSATPDAASEATIGRRTLSVSSIHGTATYAQQLADMYRDLAAAEGRAPQLGALSYRTAVSGGFTSTQQRNVLLNGAETSSVFFVGRSFLPDLGVRPLVGIAGGSISYGAGQWSLALNPVPVAVDSTWAPLPIKWAQNLRLADLHPSVTVGDAHYLDAVAPGWLP